MPSATAMISAIAQPSIDGGPPSEDINNGMVMNGPMPIMFDMFSAVACSKPKRRSTSELGVQQRHEHADRSPGDRTRSDVGDEVIAGFDLQRADGRGDRRADA